jgi:hypothetical protein
VAHGPRLARQLILILDSGSYLRRSNSNAKRKDQEPASRKLAATQKQSTEHCEELLRPMTCHPPRSSEQRALPTRGALARVPLLLHMDIEAPSRPHLQPSLCHFPWFQQALTKRGWKGRQHERFAAPPLELLSSCHGNGAVEPHVSPDEVLERAANQVRSWAVNTSRGRNVQGRALQQRDDLAERGEQDLHHPFLPSLACLTAI